MVYVGRVELERYRRDNMSVMQAADFFSFREIDKGKYVDENLSIAGELNGNARRDFDKLELELAQMAIERGYEFVTNIVPSHGSRTISISCCGFKKKTNGYIPRFR